MRLGFFRMEDVFQPLFQTLRVGINLIFNLFWRRGECCRGSRPPSAHFSSSSPSPRPSRVTTPRPAGPGTPRATRGAPASSRNRGTGSTAAGWTTGATTARPAPAGRTDRSGRVGVGWIDRTVEFKCKFIRKKYGTVELRYYKVDGRNWAVLYREDEIRKKN